jgi:tetratricopeptide (TPR) repeat protein
VIVAVASSAALAWWLSCGRGDSPSESAGGSDGVRVTFLDVTDESGIEFVHESGARGERFNPETFGPGAGWLDYDGDGWIDLLLVNGNTLVGERDPKVTSRLFRNRGDGTFDDVTEAAGLAIPFYGMGFTSADVDADGDADIFLYGLRESFLLLNDGGRFRDHTATSGLSGLDAWVGSAAFLDYDDDGHLDLFVGNYVDWSPAREEGVDCRFGTPSKHYCPVAMFPATGPQLFRGRGDGTFVETTREAGLEKLRGKALGVVVEDFDGDGAVDLFVANDSVPNFLLRNLGDGRFEERGLESGFATDGSGAALAGMGIDAVWRDDGGPLVVAVGNFSGEPTTVHVQDSGEFFAERSLGMTIGRESLDRVTFGLLLEDFDLDGHVDLLQANGHVFDLEHQTKIPYRQTAQLFLGGPEGALSASTAAGGGDLFTRAMIGRALAAADYDRDGDLDVVVTENQGRARLYRNDSRTRGRPFRVTLRGTKSHRDAIGAEIWCHLRSADGSREIRRTVKGSSSYLSQSERVITFAILPGESFERIRVRWPSGSRQRFTVDSSATSALLVEDQATDAWTVPLDGDAENGRTTSAIESRRRGREHLESGRLEEALGELDATLAREPDDFVAWRLKISTLYRLRRGSALDEAVKSAVGRFPSPNFLASHFAIVLREQGYRELAARFYREVVRLAPDRHDVWNDLGNLAFDKGSYDDALACFEKTLAVDAKDLEALTNIGKVYTIRKKFDLAARHLEAALAVSKDHAAALSTLGAVRFAQKDFDAAERLLRDALTHATSDTVRLEVYGNQGILYSSRRKRGLAIESFERVLEIDAGNAKARTALERLREP